MLLVLASIPLMVLAVALATVSIMLAMQGDRLAQRGAGAPVRLPRAWPAVTDDVPVAA